MKRLLLCMTLAAVLVCGGAAQGASNHWKLDIQNMEEVWFSGAAIDIVEEGVTWNIMRLPTITGTPSPTFATDPWISLIQSDGSGGEPTDPNIVFQIFGDVTAGQWGSGGSTTIDAVHADYTFVGVAGGGGFVDPPVTSYDWSVTNLAADTRYVLMFHSMNNPARAGKFTANGVEVELNQANTDTAILLADSDSNGDIIGTAEAFTGEFNWAGFEIQLAQDPLITVQPVGANAFIGDTVQFGVEAVNPAGGELSYQWYADPNTSEDGDETALEDGGDVSGATADTVTIGNVEEADFVWYYCEVSNTSGTVVSDAAGIILKEFLYHWKLDGDGVEANGTGLDGSLEGVSEFVAEGKIDGGLSVDGLDGLLRVPEVTMTPTDSISISFWVNPNDVSGDWKGMLAKWEAPSPHSVKTFWIGQHSTNGQLNFSFYPGNSEVRVVSTPVMSNGQWTHFVCTHDGSTLRIYADGVLNATAAAGTGWVERNGDLLMGYVPTDGANWFGGLIDDVQVYNYAMSGVEVATMFTDVEGGQVCVDATIFEIANGRTLDLNGDCKIDLQDFAIVAADWMKCNLYPVSACE